VAFEKAVVSGDFRKSRFVKVVVRQLKAPLVEQL
jgi:hypothetical protein